MAVVDDNTEDQLTMEPNKQYLSQITRRDMEQITHAANTHQGTGIEIQVVNDGYEISIDRDQLTRWVKTIINGGNI